MQVSLKHVDTGKWLAMMKNQFGRPISGQHEVVGAAKKDGLGLWQAAEGVYLPAADASAPAQAPSGREDL